MIKKIFRSTTHSITGAALVLGAASFVSRVMGLVRDRIFAHTFGAGDVLDAYYAAFRVPDLVYNLLIVGALSAGFIPIFISVYEKNKKKAWELTNSIMTILGLALILLCTLLIIFTPQLMPIVVPGFNEEKREITILLTRIMFVSPMLLGISSVVSGVLQSLKSFFIYSLTPIMYNIGIIIGALVFTPLVGIAGLAYGVVLGAFFHLAIQLPSLWHHGFRLRPGFYLRHKEIKHIGTLMIPRTLGLAAAQLNLLVITILASTLAAGSLSIFTFASNLQYFPIGIIGYSFAIAAFPTLSQFAAKKKYGCMTEHISKTVRQILFFILPMSVIFMLLRAQIVRVVLGTGAFDWDATITTGNALAFFALSLFAQCLIPLLARAFFSIQDTWTPFVIAFISALFNIIFSLLLKDTFGIIGLALAFSISMILQLVMLWIMLRLKIGSLRESEMLPSLYKIMVASLLMAVTIQSLKHPLSLVVNMDRFWGIFAQGAIAGGTGLLVFTLASLLLQVEEMESLTSSLKRRWLNLSSIRPEVNEADEI